MIYDTLLLKHISNEHYKILAMNRGSYDGDDTKEFIINELKNCISKAYLNMDTNSDLLDQMTGLLGNSEVTLEDINAGFMYSGYRLVYVQRPDITDETIGDFTSIIYAMKGDSAFGMTTSDENTANISDAYVNMYKTYLVLPNQIDSIVEVNRDLEEYSLLKTANSSNMYDITGIRNIFDIKKYELLICHV